MSDPVSSSGPPRPRLRLPRAPRRPHWLCRLPVLALALPALLLAACSSSQPSSADSQMNGPEIDYRARQERVYDAVLLRPTQVRTQLQVDDQLQRRQDTAAWQAVMARQGATVRKQGQAQGVDATDFLRMVQRQQSYAAARERARTERAAQFPERSAPPVPPASGAGSRQSSSTP